MVGRYYTPDGMRHKVKGYSDKKATETKAAELERRGIRVDAGLVDPTDVHAKTPLAEHAEDFRRYLAAKGNTAIIVAKMSFRLTAVLDGCRFVQDWPTCNRPPLSKFLEALRGQGQERQDGERLSCRRQGLHPLALADKRQRCSTRWPACRSWRTGKRTFATPAATSRRTNWPGCWTLPGKAPRRFAACPAPTGTFLYLTACATGFRVSELASMTPESFDLDGDTPTATVQASCTKNRKEAVQPLPAGRGQGLRDYLADKPAGVPLWPGNLDNRERGSRMIRRDLAAARRHGCNRSRMPANASAKPSKRLPGLSRRGRPLR